MSSNAYDKVEVEEDRVLQISGEQEEKNNKWHQVERSSGKFLRRFRLPESAKTDEVKASMENGMLTVTMLKVEVKKPLGSHDHEPQVQKATTLHFLTSIRLAFFRDDQRAAWLKPSSESTMLRSRSRFAMRERERRRRRLLQRTTMS